MSSMQVCYCGWSKVTTYQGLRTHQGKMGCTPRGMSIPESDQFRFTRCTFANIGPSIQIEEPLKDIFGPYLEIDHQQFAWRNALEETLQNDSGRNNGITPVWEIPQTSDENLLLTTYQGLRTHQGMMGRTQRGYSIPQSDQLRLTSSLHGAANVGPFTFEPLKFESKQITWRSPLKESPQQDDGPNNFIASARGKNVPVASNFTTLTAAPAAEATLNDINQLFATAQQNSQQTATNSDTTHQGRNFSSGAQPSLLPMPQMFGTPTIPAAAEVPVMKTQQSSLQNTTNSDQTHQAFNFSSGAQPMHSVSQMFGTRTTPAAAGITVNDTNKSFVATQQNFQQTATNINRQAFPFSSGAQPSLLPMPQMFGTPTIPAEVPVMKTQQSSLQNATNSDQTHQAFTFSSGAQPSLLPMPQMFGTPTIPAAAEVPVMKTQQSSLQNATNSDQTHQAFNPSSGAQASLMPMSQIFGSPTFPTVKDVTVTHTNKSMFETPPHLSTTHQNTNNVRRALDFSTGAQQVGQLDWELPTTTAQETAIQLKEREREREREMEKEREAQQLQKMRQDMIRADLHQKIQTREQKISEVTSSVKACKGGLDAEWLEINSVFSEVMKVVEDSRKKALQPLEERRQRVSRAGKDQVKKLQNEIDKIRKTIDELDKNADLQGLPKTGLDESRDWKHLTVDTSFSFGSLRATTSSMMEQIHQQLEKLSSVELKRIPTFAVDVKLNPTTAHQCLVLSPDGKTVRDGGNYQKVPDAPQRFDMFGSILGLNRLTSGKSYWEVEVTKKSGWDLGVARRNANRKGKLSVNSDNGYWVVVHYKDKKYAALTVPPVSLPLKEKPEKVGVFVDYEERLVSFYDVMAQSHIYTFTECMFSDVILPYFSPHPKQNEKNSHPLIISPVKKQL
ncbi:uncharacterized protein [Pseudochaenichthys georgianus]|uniref:uncharacterized protein isoform X2 n=1 Tax=Pseudochaenichthys georgianus TaxID=52239 RepID=UPI00146EEE28|nr:uncharacterized protein LOC117463494 isoform X2 [Pseudochaenichthys georgianus]